MRVKTSINDFKEYNSQKGVWVPKQVTLELIYHQRDSETKEMISAELSLQEFNEIPDKNKIFNFYCRLFNISIKDNKTNINATDIMKITKLYTFFAERTNREWMTDISQFLLVNYYSNSTQFKRLFPKYFDYFNMDSFGENITSNLKESNPRLYVCEGNHLFI